MSTTYHPKGFSKPYLNISAGYAHIPCVMMREGYYDGVGSISHNVLPLKLEMVGAAPVDVHVCADLVDKNYTSQGRTHDNIIEYKMRLISIIEFCIKNKVDLVWG